MRYWWRILCVNAVASVAVVGISGGFTPGIAWSTRGRNLGVAWLYANCIGTILAMAIPWVAGRCRFQRPVAIWAAILATLVVGTCAGTLVATGLLVAFGIIPSQRFREWFVGALSTSLFISMAIGVAVTVYETLRDRLEEATVALRTKERDEAEARRLAAEAQLASLESRVQPHFLFNTLNSIAALTHDNPARAEKMTTDLASLLRSSLDQQTTALVTLDEELGVVRSYLEIERVRFGDRLRYHIDVEGSAGSARVPRLAVQTLVENAVKYAVSPRRDGGTINVRAAVAEGRVRLDVEDDGPGFDPSVVPDGHGIALLRARLAMLFETRAALRIESAPGRTRLSIELPA